MAVPFSIREYTLGMRDKDVAKCWPFDGEPALPPMEVKKSHCLSADLATTKLNEKPKGPKKRSIADIFAVAPIVEREDMDDDHMDDENEDQEGDDPMVLALFDAKIKKKILRKVEKSKKKMKSGSDCINRKNPLKAKPAPLIPKNSLCKGSEENTSCAVPMPKKKRLKLKGLASQKKKKPLEASKSIKHRKSDFTVANNMNSCREGVSADQQDKSSDTAKAMGMGDKGFPSLEHAKFQNFTVPFSYEKDHIEERGKNLAPNENSDSDVNLHFACDAVCPNEIPKIRKPGIGFGMNLSGKLMEENQVARRIEDSQTYASSSRFPPLRKEGDNRNPNNADISRSSTMRITEYIDAFPQLPFPFVSTNVETQNRLPFSARNGKLVNFADYTRHHQSFPYLSPEELSRNTVSIPDMKQRVVTGDVRYTNQDFCCLPLNSQGELIQMNSIGRGKGLPVHDLQTSNRIDFAHFKDNNIRGGTKSDELFTSPPKQNFVNDHSKFPMFNGLAGSRNEEGHYFDFFKRNSHVYDLQSTLELMYPAQYGWNQYNQIHYQLEDGKKSDRGQLHMSQHTMRLMGKDLTVGKSNDDSQSSEDGNIWTDKQIIAEHHSPATSVIGTSSIENSPLYTNNIQIDQSSQKFLQPHPPPLETTYPQFHPFISRDHSPQLHPYFPSSPSSPFTNQDFPLQDPFVYRYEYDSPHVNRSSNSADLSHPTRPAFEFPFLPPVCRENMKPSSSLAPWLLSAKQNIETPTTSYISYLDVGGRHPSSYPSFPYVPNHISSLSNRQNFVSPASFAPPTPPTSLMNNIHGYRMIPRVNVMDSDKGKATRKRRVDILNKSLRRAKMHDLKVQDFGGNKMARPNTTSSELNLLRGNINNMDCGVSSLGPEKHIISSAATKSDRVSELQRKLTPMFRF